MARPPNSWKSRRNNRCLKLEPGVLGCGHTCVTLPVSTKWRWNEQRKPGGITKRRLSGPKRKMLNAVATYFTVTAPERAMTKFLAKGWPIACGPVEGA
ncbi:hypothetical protein SBA3_1820056 [Candidatus Sulfopaludibacter sp. SbA3]|nr:hypothetical protein SBA3_1820056 [Candidatus Sulfopaludibacter sp. SbA3]